MKDAVVGSFAKKAHSVALGSSVSTGKTLKAQLHGFYLFLSLLMSEIDNFRTFVAIMVCTTDVT